MKKSVLLLIAVATLIQSLTAQKEQVVGKLFYAELGGPGLIMSANFDARFNSNARLGFGYRTGAGFGFYKNIFQPYLSVPAGLNYVFGKPNSAHAFEVGAGVTFFTRKQLLFCLDEKKEGHAIGFLTFMYRMAPVNGGFSFRTGLTPIIGTAGEMAPMGTIGFGYAF